MASQIYDSFYLNQ